MTDIRKDDRRAGDVIEQMRALIKRRTLEMNPLALNELVQDVFSLVHSDAMARHVALDSSVAPGLPLVAADRVHLSQVLLNLIMNGMDAMQTAPAGTKRLLIEGRHSRLDTLLELSASLQALTHATADHREAVNAFLEKRAPVFKGD